ncbi:MAG: PDZ domain-containing protein [Blastocatellia bacterium]|nr:PDZ domain-containing protein [Blastocatellia bacterium]
MKSCLPAVLALLAIASTQAVAQNKSDKPSLAGAKIFIEPMEGDLHPFIAAEVVEKRLPVVIVMERKNAEYILTGSFIKGGDKWNRTALGLTDKNQGSVQLLNVKDKTIVWAGEADDRSSFLGGWSRGGQRKVADRIINKMKKDLFSFQRTDTDDQNQRNSPPKRDGQAARDGAATAIVDSDQNQRNSPPKRDGQTARDSAVLAIVNPDQNQRNGLPKRDGQAARDGAATAIMDPTKVRQKYEEAVQNALGFKQGVYSATEFPGVQGIFINNLMSDDSPAALANIQAGDLLTELNNQHVRNDSELSQVLESLETGQEVPVKLYRDGEVTSSRIKIADRALPPAQPKIELRDQGFLGIRDSFRRPLPGTKKWGVEVKELHINSPAKLNGLRPGDVITEFNGRPVKTPNEFNRQIRAVRPGSKVVVKFYRGGAEQKIEVTIGHLSEEIEKSMRRGVK